MKLEVVEIDHYRAIERLRLPLDPSLTVLHGANTCGKTSVLSAIAVGLGVLPEFLPGASGIDFLETDSSCGRVLRPDRPDCGRRALLEARALRYGTIRKCRKRRPRGLDALKDKLSEIVHADP